jgi:hypothetical protein
LVQLRGVAILTEKLSNIRETTNIAYKNKQQLLPSTKRELPAWIYVRGKVQFESMCCLEGIECTVNFDLETLKYVLLF